jgi:hypothetical protein
MEQPDTRRAEPVSGDALLAAKERIVDLGIELTHAKEADRASEVERLRLAFGAEFDVFGRLADRGVAHGIPPTSFEEAIKRLRAVIGVQLTAKKFGCRRARARELWLRAFASAVVELITAPIEHGTTSSDSQRLEDPSR